jgi:hypothetical protein
MRSENTYLLLYIYSYGKIKLKLREVLRKASLAQTRQQCTIKQINKQQNPFEVVYTVHD